MEELKLSLKREEIKVLLETEEDGEQEYVLREMTGKSRDTYLSKLAGKMRYDLKGEMLRRQTRETSNR